MTAPDDCPDLRFAIEWRTAREYERIAAETDDAPVGWTWVVAASSTVALYYYLEFWRKHTEAS